MNLDLGELKVLIRGNNFTVYHRRRFIEGKVLDRVTLRAVVSPHGAMDIELGNVNEAIIVLKGAVRVLKEA